MSTVVLELLTIIFDISELCRVFKAHTLTVSNSAGPCLWVVFSTRRGGRASFHDRSWWYCARRAILIQSLLFRCYHCQHMSQSLYPRSCELTLLEEYWICQWALTLKKPVKSPCYKRRLCFLYRYGSFPAWKLLNPVAGSVRTLKLSWIIMVT